MTPSSVVSPLAERLERFRVLRAARALVCFRAELPRRAADPPLDERPLERPFDARAFDPDLEEPDDAPRRWDVLVSAMLSLSLLGNPFSDPLPAGKRSNPLQVPCREVFLAHTQRGLKLLAALLRHVGCIEELVRELARLFRSQKMPVVWPHHRHV